MAAIKGTSNNDVLTGSTADDTLAGSAGTDFLAGGAGRDTAIFSGKSSDYSVRRVYRQDPELNEAASYLTVTDLNTTDGNDGTDYLLDIEQMQFSDRTLAIKQGGTIKTNTNATEAHLHPSVVTLSDGGWLVSWQTTDSNRGTIFSQRYDATGREIDSAAQLNTTTTDQTSFSVTALSSGWLISWQGNGQGDNDGIFTQRYDAEGQPASSEALVNVATTGRQNSPSVISLSDGGWLVTWESQTADGSNNVLSRRYDASGIPQNGEIKSNSTAVSPGTSTVTALSDGGWITSWFGENSSNIGSVFAQRHDATGNLVEGEKQASEHWATTTKPSVAALSDGGWIIAWPSVDEYYNQGIAIQRYDKTGTPVSSPSHLPSYPQGDISATGLADGGWLLTWNYGIDVYYNRFDSEGNSSPYEIPVDVKADNPTSNSTAVALADGGWLISWSERKPDGTGEIYTQRYDSKGKAQQLEVQGTSQNDTLRGEGLITLAGGAGNDIYILSSNTDLTNATTVLERHNEGIDTVYSYYSYHSLADNIENCRIMTAGGNSKIIGNNLDNTIYVKNQGDEVDGGAGLDTIDYSYATYAKFINLDYKTAPYSYSLYTSIERYIGSNYSDTLIGDSASNIFEGGRGNDTLNGMTGADKMTGGDGSDLYYVDNAGDKVIELNSTSITGGIDTVYSTLAAYTLTSNVENGHIRAAGIANISGNSLDNTLKGNSTRNTLIGGLGSDILDGGADADTLIGGEGSDIYYIDNAGDLVTETNTNASTGGVDSIYSYLTSYTLASNIENGRILAAGTANISGNNLNNLLYAGNGNNVLNGGTGNDTLSYLHASNAVAVNLATKTAQATSGSGTDTLISIENLTGSNFNDKLTGNTAQNIISGGRGDDELDGGAGADTLIGGDGADFYYVDNLTDVVIETNSSTSTGGNDTVASHLTNYTLGANIEGGLILASGNANLTGNNINNVLYAGDGNNVLNGGAGKDAACYIFSKSTVTVSLAIIGIQTTKGSGSDKLIGIEDLIGSNHHDNLTGNSANNTLNGAAGADIMTGGNGSDVYYVDNVGDKIIETNVDASTGGVDAVYSLIANYTLTSRVENGHILTTGTANLTGNNLNNFLYAGRGDNVLNGSSGTDTASYIYAGSAVAVNLANNLAQTTNGSGLDKLVAIENLTGSNYNDTLTGNNTNNTLNGGLGNDILNGGTGADTLLGGEGSDSYYVDNTGDKVLESIATASLGGTDTVLSYLSNYLLGSNIENGRILTTNTANLTGNSLDNVLYAGSGNNVVNGGAGFDTASYLHTSSAITANLSNTTAQVSGGSGSDTLISIENLVGSNYNDTLTGNSANNILNGGQGNDTLNGGAGNDLLIDGPGQDRLTGGAGNDTFMFVPHPLLGTHTGTRDIITDFAQGTDKLDLSWLDANMLTAGDDAFTEIVGVDDNFTRGGQLKFENGVLYVNMNEDYDPEFVIQLIGISSLSLSDFVA